MTFKNHLLQHYNRSIEFFIQSTVVVIVQLIDRIVNRIQNVGGKMSLKFIISDKMQKNLKNFDEKKIAEQVKNIMANSDPVKYILQEHQKMHIGDRGIALTLLLSIAVQSVSNSQGIQPKVSGESGKGKTHCCKAMAHLMPSGWILETTLSDKVIYRMPLKDGMVIFSDDVDLSTSLENTIKRATTNFQEETVYTTLNKEHDVNYLSIPSRIVWWLTSVDDNQSIQLLNRQFGGGVDETPEQDEKVLLFQKDQATTGKMGLPLTEEVMVCRGIINNVKEQNFTVKIPFAHRINWPHASNRRNFEMFTDLIYGFAVLRHEQRNIDETGVLIADIMDFESARELYSSRAKTQLSKTTNSENRLLEALVKLDYRATYEELCQEVGLSQGRISQLLTGKGKGHDSGLLHKIPSLSIDMTGHKHVVVLDKSYKSDCCEITLKEL